MITLKMISEKISAWLRNREAVHELPHFSDHEPCDIRIRSSDIEDVVRRLCRPNAPRTRQLCALIRAQFLGRGETSSRDTNVGSPRG
jgi:uncharacterized protein YjiS (DUF1127 family)